MRHVQLKPKSELQHLIRDQLVREILGKTDTQTEIKDSKLILDTLSQFDKRQSSSWDHGCEEWPALCHCRCARVPQHLGGQRGGRTALRAHARTASTNTSQDKARQGTLSLEKSLLMPVEWAQINPSQGHNSATECADVLPACKHSFITFKLDTGAKASRFQLGE